MSRIRQAFLLALTLATTAAWADLIHPWPGAAQQTTCELCFFPTGIAAVVYDTAGARKPGATVTFQVPSQDVAFVPNAGPGPYTVVTDGSGVARLPHPGLIAARAGNFTVTATTPGSSVTFNLTVEGSPPTHLTYIQFPLGGVVNVPYADQFIVHARGADGLARPNAAIVFMPVAGGASGSFEVGGTHGYAQAGSNGLAYAPVFRANEVAGQGEILAATFNPAANHLVISHFNSAA